MEYIELLKYAQRGVLDALEHEERIKRMLNGNGMASPVADHRITRHEAALREIADMKAREERRLSRLAGVA